MGPLPRALAGIALMVTVFSFAIALSHGLLRPLAAALVVFGFLGVFWGYLIPVCLFGKLRPNNYDHVDPELLSHSESLERMLYYAIRWLVKGSVYAAFAGLALNALRVILEWIG